MGVFVIEEILRASNFKRRIEKLSIFNETVLISATKTTSRYIFLSINMAKQGFNDKNYIHTA